jgi:hypothetical protein
LGCWLAAGSCVLRIPPRVLSIAWKTHRTTLTISRKKKILFPSSFEDNFIFALNFFVSLFTPKNKKKHGGFE